MWDVIRWLAVCIPDDSVACGLVVTSDIIAGMDETWGMGSIKTGLNLEMEDIISVKHKNRIL